MIGDCPPPAGIYPLSAVKPPKANKDGSVSTPRYVFPSFTLTQERLDAQLRGEKVPTIYIGGTPIGIRLDEDEMAPDLLSELRDSNSDFVKQLKAL